jgi:hypothetical protein
MNLGGKASFTQQLAHFERLLTSARIHASEDR